MKNLLKMSDLSPAELTHILDVADQLKADCKAGRTEPLLAGKSVALLFSKASTRTRTSFEVGVYQMGGLGNYMNTAELQAGRGEPLRDTARVLGHLPPAGLGGTGRAFRHSGDQRPYRLRTPLSGAG